ncbi:elongation factor 1-alpha, partial [Candidatus Woesearchaeota archaeon]|nr:elongation factor 1-alpha [Candidatus Woesearchaeota archaeon]
NMITGASQADAAVLVVAANDGINAQTKEHAFLAKVQGIDQVVVLVNKMDLQQYSQDRFNAVKDEVTKLLKGSGFRDEQIKGFIPTVSLQGQNIVNKSENMSWYDGKTLLQTLDSFDVPEKPVDLPLRIPVQDAYNITGIGCVPVGKIETGILKVGQKVTAVPGREGKGVHGEIKSIEMHHQNMPQAVPGDNVGISIRGFNKRDVARGDVLGDASNVPTIAEEFTAMITVINHPSVLTVGYTPVCHIHTSQVACQFLEIQAKLDPASGQVVEEKPDMLRNGDTAIVRLKPTTPTVIETKDTVPQLSKFAIRDSGATVAAGVCLKIDKKVEL